MTMKFDKEIGTTKAFEIKMEELEKEDEPMHGVISDFMYHNNVAQANIYIRMGFLRKVFSILGVQLLLTTLISIAFLLTPIIQQFLLENTWALWISIISNFITLFFLLLNSRNFPKNFYLLTLFTILNAISVGFFVSFQNAYDIILALSITVVVVVSLILYTCQTKRDLSKIGFMSYTLLLTLLGAGIFQFLFPTSSIYRIILAAIGVLCFSGFILYDVDQINRQFSPEDYIEATVTLYLDILNLFLQILQLISEINRR
ncbi:hypothetical protein SNEBB_000145 [Seison nebaliae]|nr:hypothetical protein SNEBB_000145 [Seison nebaliae]